MLSFLKLLLFCLELAPLDLVWSTSTVVEVRALFMTLSGSLESFVQGLLSSSVLLSVGKSFRCWCALDLVFFTKGNKVDCVFGCVVPDGLGGGSEACCCLQIGAGMRQR
jgi:hypothetical protein